MRKAEDRLFLNQTSGIPVWGPQRIFIQNLASGFASRGFASRSAASRFAETDLLQAIEFDFRKADLDAFRSASRFAGRSSFFASRGSFFASRSFASRFAGEFFAAEEFLQVDLLQAAFRSAGGVASSFASRSSFFAGRGFTSRGASRSANAVEQTSVSSGNTGEQDGTSHQGNDTFHKNILRLNFEIPLCPFGLKMMVYTTKPSFYAN